MYRTIVSVCTALWNVLIQNKKHTKRFNFLRARVLKIKTENDVGLMYMYF